jgi:1-phosphofructokinase family hexose kinase
MIICVAGNPSVDKLFEVEHLVPGAIHRPQAFLALPGGKGLHVAQVATALGGDALATGILAGHSGRWVADCLDREGVPCRFVWGAGETRSSLSVADRATGRLTEFYEDGLPPDPGEWSSLVEIVGAALGQADWLVLAGGLRTEGQIDGYPELIALAHKAGVPVAVDSGGEALREAIVSGPELVKINQHEAGELLGTHVDGIASAHTAAIELRARIGGNGHAAVITLGEQGMVLAEPSGEIWHGGVAARGSYPVGSGDAFLGGLMTALVAGDSWPRAATLGLGAGAANAEVPGAARLDPERARRLADEAVLERLGAAG